ncbi:SGNH/GDSL hydrolase family protein [Metamycoplasma hominis]|uniref:SGNH/GDSL hydrolase family protein n=1 Tax=Metamycoplasma hominis TaxID=2098 RepID=UPI00193A4C03|nr:SGNH/GDSL hydrolase family protein [Metamycoplasma hominis]
MAKNQKYNLNDEIKYVALGDSFAAGFNSKVGFNTNGKLSNGNIDGLGYPSFLALKLRDLNYRLTSFYNLAIPAGNLDIIYALTSNNENDLIANSKSLDLLQSIDWHVSNPSKNFFDEFFLNWNISKKNFSFYKETISRANFITITAGFSDLIFKMPFYKLTNLITAKNETKANLIIEIKKDFENIGKEIILKYQKLVEYIQKINPLANIVVTNYAKPFMALQDLINSIYISSSYNNEFDLVEMIQDLLNNVAKEVAKKCQCLYVDIYEEKYWKEHQNYLYENLFSWFCTEKGYKKVAYDLLAKLSLTSEFKMSNLIQYCSDSKYWNETLENQDQQLFSLYNNDLDLLENIYGINKNFNILIDSKLEISLKRYLYKHLNNSEFIQLINRYSSYDIHNIAWHYLKNKFFGAKTKYEFYKLIDAFLSNETNSKAIFLTLFKDGKIDDILFRLQSRLEDVLLTKKTIINFDLREQWNYILGNYQYLIYDVFKQFFSAGIIEENKEEIKKIALTFAKESLNTDLLMFLFSFNDNQKYIEIKKFLSQLNTFKEFIYFIVETLLNYSDIYAKLKTFDELWTNLIVNNKYNLIYLLDKAFIEISRDEEIQETINFILNTYFSKQNCQELKPRDKKIASENIKYILETFKNHSYFLNNLFNHFINKIKTISPYNLIVKTKKLNSIFKLRNIIIFDRYVLSSLKISKAILVLISIKNKNKL